MKRLWLLAGVVLALAGGLTAWAADGGKLKVNTPGMVIEADIRGRKVALPPLREIPVGAGTIKTAGLKLHAQGKDKKNRPVIWRLDGIKPYGKLEEIEVSATETTVVEGGAPITVLAPARLLTKGSSKQIYVDLALYGKSEERYRTVVYMGRTRVPNPKVAFLDESGKVLHTGAFEYG